MPILDGELRNICGTIGNTVLVDQLVVGSALPDAVEDFHDRIVVRMFCAVFPHGLSLHAGISYGDVSLHLFCLGDYGVAGSVER